MISIEWLVCQDSQGGDQCPLAPVWWLLSACRCECAAAQGGEGGLAGRSGNPMSRFSWEAVVNVREVYKTHFKTKTVMVSVNLCWKCNHRNLYSITFSCPLCIVFFCCCKLFVSFFQGGDFQVPSWFFPG